MTFPYLHFSSLHLWQLTFAYRNFASLHLWQLTDCNGTGTGTYQTCYHISCFVKDQGHFGHLAGGMCDDTPSAVWELNTPLSVATVLLLSLYCGLWPMQAAIMWALPERVP